MSEKSEAQVKNEEAVRRIIQERGYSLATNKKQVTKTFGRSFSIKPFITGFITVGLLFGGWMYLRENLFGDKQHEGQFSEITTTKDDQEISGFYACLGEVDASEINLDDVEFWRKHIDRYEQTIACYDKYPSVGSLSEKNKLQTTLAEFQENAKQADANDVEYRANMARIDVELEQNLARIKEESKAWDTEISRRVQERQAQSAERQAEYARQQEERERQAAAAEAQRQQQEQAAKAKCDEYLAMYGDKTPAEIAESDSEVVNAKYRWTQAQKKIRDCVGGNTVPNQSQRELCNSYRDQELQAAESYYSTYINLLQQKTNHYRNLKINACGH